MVTDKKLEEFRKQKDSAQKNGTHANILEKESRKNRKANHMGKLNPRYPGGYYE